MSSYKYNAAPNAISENKRSKQIVTATDWNSLFNILAVQTNLHHDALNAIFSYLFSDKTIQDTSQMNQMGAVFAELALKAPASETDLHLKNVTFDPTTGHLLFTKENGTVVDIDLPTEKVPARIYVEYSTRTVPGSSTSKTTWWLVIEDTVGGETYCEVANLYNKTEYESSVLDILESSIAQGKTKVTFGIKNNVISENMFNAVLKTKFNSMIDACGDYKDQAESYAVGGTGTRPDEDTDNAKYYKELAEDSASNASGAETRAVLYANLATTKAGEALEHATSSSDHADDSLEQALVSEGYAVGTQNDVPVSSDSPYYHNNAKYYSDNAGELTVGKEDKNYLTIAGVTHQMEVVTSDPGYGTAGKIIFYVE